MLQQLSWTWLKYTKDEHLTTRLTKTWPPNHKKLAKVGNFEPNRRVRSKETHKIRVNMNHERRQPNHKKPTKVNKSNQKDVSEREGTLQKPMNMHHTRREFEPYEIC